MASPGPVTALIAQLEAGDHEAARPLWERYAPRLLALARKRLQGTSRRVADEEDVALSAFDSLCRAAEQGRFPRLGGRDDLWALLVLITVRKAADLANRNRREPVVGPLPADSGEGGLSQAEGDDPAPGIAAELAEEFRLWLERLADPELRAIAVWKMEGSTNAEVAARLGCSEPTVERRLRLIRKILQGG
jgi:RNA polymerase sigma factor (sigma-70 family)